MPNSLYHIVRVNDRTGVRICLTAYPMPHDECMVMMRKMLDLSPWPYLRNVLQEVRQ